MLTAEQVRQSLEHLGLMQAAAVLDSRLQTAAQKKLAYVAFRADLLTVETTARRERYLRTRMRLAHRPFQRTLEQCDVRFQPSIDERQVKALATLGFISDAANVILLSPPGVGKTHLAVALSIRAIDQGSGVYFVRAHDLLEDLRRAQAEPRLDRRMRVYLAPQVLVIDEFGVRPYDRLAATGLFALISARYERGSVLRTSTKGFAEWGEVLGDPVIATAILDRLLHHSHVLNIRGESYRLREKKRAGLLTGPSAPTTDAATPDAARGR